MLKNYNDWERSLLWNVEQIRAGLEISDPAVEAMTLFCLTYELDKLQKQVGDSKILAKFSLGPTNPEVSNTTKDNRILKFSIEFWRLDHREHCKVIQAIMDSWQPGLNFRLWNTHDSDDFASWTEDTAAYIKDFREGDGYNGADGRYVIPFAVDLKYPKL